MNVSSAPVAVTGLSSGEADIQQGQALRQLAEEVAKAVHNWEYTHLEAALHEVRHLNRDILQYSEMLLAERGFIKGREWDTGLLRSDESLRRLFSIHAASKDLSLAVSLHELSRNPGRAGESIGEIEIHKAFHRQRFIVDERLRTKSLAVNIGQTSKAKRLSEAFKLIPKLLFDNAVKYSDPNTAIEIRFEETPSSFRIRMRNTGKIVRPAECKDVFQLGYRGTNRGESPGSGVGLWLVKTIVQANGGKVDFEIQDKGPGTTGLGTTEVTIVLPG